VLVRKPEIPPLGIHRYIWKSNIKMDFQQIGLVVADTFSSEAGIFSNNHAVIHSLKK
jgi:hypothetical protein